MRVSHFSQKIWAKAGDDREGRNFGLVMAGGVALNCVANGKILRSGEFDNIWIQPASGDAGGAIGSALSAYHIYHSRERKPDRNGLSDGMSGSYLGPEWSNAAIKKELSALGARYGEFINEDLLSRTAAMLADNSVVGWFQGRMEFGPRALGNRSILANPKSPEMQKKLNLKIKFRESFRPFAPAVLADQASEWFELIGTSPYMLLVADVQKHRRLGSSKKLATEFGLDQINQVRSEIPAVTHVDYSACIQTVHRDTNPLFYGLIEQFGFLTGCPMVVNTSFNIRGEPIVNSVGDAFRCFMGTDMDALVIGNFILVKDEQNPKMAVNYQHHFSLD